LLRATRIPSDASLRAIQAAFVSTVSPSNSSLPIARISITGCVECEQLAPFHEVDDQTVNGEEYRNDEGRHEYEAMEPRPVIPGTHAVPAAAQRRTVDRKPRNGCPDEDVLEYCLELAALPCGNHQSAVRGHGPDDGDEQLATEDDEDD